MQIKLAAIGLALLLSGCATTEPIKPVTYHPPRPEPVETYKPEWRVMLDDSKKPFVAMSYDDSVRYRIWLEKVFGYIQKQNEIICSYRKDLKEPQCE